MPSARLLLVEDEPGLQLTLSDRLAAEGYAVETAAGGDTVETSATPEGNGDSAEEPSAEEPPADAPDDPDAQAAATEAGGEAQAGDKS